MTEPTVPAELTAINVRLDDGDSRMQRIEDRQKEMGESLQTNTEMTRDVLDMLVAWRAGMNAIAKFGRGLAAIGRWFIRVLKVLAPIAAAGAAIWTVFQGYLHGGAPK